MKEKTYFIGYLTLIYLLTIFFINLFSPSLKFSEEENRPLASKPEMNVSNVTDGSYFTSYNKYIEDQFWNRTTWKSLKTNIEKSIGLKKIDNIYFGKNNRLIEEVVIPSDDFINRRVDNIKKLQEYYNELNMDFVLIPNKVGIYYDEVSSSNKQKELYDDFISNFDNDLVKVNCFDILSSHKNENIFYNTDHHYTSLGAKYISESLYNKENIEYSEYTVNNHFIGTSAKKLAYYNIYDTVNIYVPNEEVSYYLTYNNDEDEYTSIYDSSKQYSYDPYEIFFGGNKSIIDIRTNSESESKLLLIKDSYANSFIPFILNNYREIIVIDPRYYHEDINSLINDKQITDIMLYYNINTFFEDTSLDDMIENIKL